MRAAPCTTDAGAAYGLFRSRPARRRQAPRRGGATGQQCRVRHHRRGAVQGLADEVSQTGELAALVHAAGISPSMTTDPRRILEVNLVGTAIILDAFYWKATLGTAAVCIASTSAYRRLPPDVERVLLEPRSNDFFDQIELVTPLRGRTRLAYALAKRGVRLLCQHRARQWGQRGARLCSLSPGGVTTRMSELERNRGAKRKRARSMSAASGRFSAARLAAAARFRLLVAHRAVPIDDAYWYCPCQRGPSPSPQPDG